VIERAAPRSSAPGFVGARLVGTRLSLVNVINTR
jgi:hypothetical protein